MSRGQPNDVILYEALSPYLQRARWTPDEIAALALNLLADLEDAGYEVREVQDA